MKTQRKAIAAALAFASMTGPAWAGAACIQDQDLIALRATALQQQLMVAGYACHDAAEYNRFVEIYRSQLLNADAGLMAFFIHRNAATGSDDYNAFKTKLANVAAIRSANDTTEFCGHARAAFRAALSTEKASLRDLVAVQSDKAQPVCPSDGAKTVASAVPVAKPAPAGAIAPANAIADAQSVTPVLKPVAPGIARPLPPQPLTGQKLAELYPNDPPPFSLPTTPLNANIPPIAAPTAHVAVDALAKPAAALPLQPLQAARGVAESGPSLAEAVEPAADAAAPVEDAIAAAPSFAMMAAAPAELAASGVAQKEGVMSAGQAVAANTAANFAQAPEAVAAAAPADVLSDAEMQAAALSGIGAAEATAPAEDAPAPRAAAPRYAASQYVDPSPNGEDPDLANVPPPPPLEAPPQYAPRPDSARLGARIADNADPGYADNSRYPGNAYADPRDDNSYAEPPPRQSYAPAPQRQAQVEARAVPSSYRYYSDRYGNRYAEDPHGTQYVYDSRRGRWEPVDDGSSASQPAYPQGYDPRYAYAPSPYYRQYPPGYYGR